MKFPDVLQKHINVAAIFLLVSLCIIFSWFRFGLYYGGGDVGLPTYDPIRILEISKYLWWQSSAPGVIVPNSTVSAPQALILSTFQLIGFSALLIQATYFFILLFLMGFGMYIFVFLNFKMSRKLACIAGFFYMFNPYTMVQIWHRFIHTSIVLAAFLPFIVIFWQKWVKERKVLWLFIFLLTNFLGVYLYGTIAYILTVWTFLFILTFYYAVIPWKNLTSCLKYAAFFLIGFVFWILTNLWWILPLFTIGPGLYSQQHSNNESLETLLEISKQTIIPYTLQLLNPFYLFEQSEFGPIYSNLFFKFIPWIATFIIFSGIIKSLKQKNTAIWGIVFLSLVFLAKGAATPFGYPYIKAFSKIFILGVIRNPFEKMGILLPFAASILFIFGLKLIKEKLDKILSVELSKIILIFLFFLMMLYAWPMVTGNIFGFNKPAFVKVPESYIEADKWLKSNNLEGNILHLPLTRTEGVTYTWEYGYNGVEPSPLLFTSNPSIARGFSVTRIDDALTALSLIFENSYSEKDENIISLLQSFNVRYIILHKDIIWRGRDIYDFEKTEKLLDELKFLRRKSQFGDLIIYEISPEYYQRKIVFTNQVQFVSDEKSQIRMWPWLVRNNQGQILTPINKDDTGLIFKNSNEAMIFPVVDGDVKHFYAPESGKYELLLTNSEIKEIYPDNLKRLDFQINNQIVNLKSSIKGSLLSFGEVDINKGDYTIGVTSTYSKNLFPEINKIAKSDNVKIDSNGTIQLASNGNDYSVIESDLGNVSGEDIYEVSFDARLMSGYGFLIEVIQDGDRIENGGAYVPRVATSVSLNDSNFESFKYDLQPLSITTRTNAKIRFIVDPRSVASFIPSPVPMAVEIKNITVKRVLNNPFFLRKTLTSDQELPISSGQIMDLKQQSPVYYTGRIKVEKPGFLIFNESYHSGWELTLQNPSRSYKPGVHVLSNLFGNAWYVDKIGEYDFEIVFKPQNFTKLGIFLSIFGAVMLLVVIGFNFFKKKQ